MSRDYWKVFHFGGTQGGTTGRCLAVVPAIHHWCDRCQTLLLPLFFFFLYFFFLLKYEANLKPQKLEFGNSNRHETNFIGKMTTRATSTKSGN
jgi:hypothetical protein